MLDRLSISNFNITEGCFEQRIRHLSLQGCYWHAQLKPLLINCIPFQFRGGAELCKIRHAGPSVFIAWESGARPVDFRDQQTGLFTGRRPISQPVPKVMWREMELATPPPCVLARHLHQRSVVDNYWPVRRAADFCCSYFCCCSCYCQSFLFCMYGTWVDTTTELHRKYHCRQEYFCDGTRRNAVLEPFFPLPST
jgi:hypothetical protein